MLSLLLAVVMGNDTTRNITFHSADGFALRGALELPAKATGKVPCVVLHPGSGPTDRDGNQPQFKLTTNLMVGLGAEIRKHGIATFRFDKRASWVYQKDWPKDPAKYNKFFGWQNHLNDFTAAVDAVRAQKEIDGRAISLLGHSEGGILALAVRTKVKPISIILLGTPGRPIDALIHDQIYHLLSVQVMDDATRADLKKQTALNLASIRKEGKVQPNVHQGLRALFNPYVTDLLQAEMLFKPTSVSGFGGPVLIMNGEMDSQVSPVKDAGALRAARKTDSITEFLIVLKASHNLKKVRTNADPGIEGVIAPVALKALGAFVAKFGHLRS